MSADSPQWTVATEPRHSAGRLLFSLSWIIPESTDSDLACSRDQRQVVIHVPKIDNTANDCWLK
jgi:hypothetical protein